MTCKVLKYGNTYVNISYKLTRFRIASDSTVALQHARLQAVACELDHVQKGLLVDVLEHFHRTQVVVAVQVNRVVTDWKAVFFDDAFPQKLILFLLSGCFYTVLGQKN